MRPRLWKQYPSTGLYCTSCANMSRCSFHRVLCTMCGYCAHYRKPDIRLGFLNAIVELHAVRITKQKDMPVADVSALPIVLKFHRHSISLVVLLPSLCAASAWIPRRNNGCHCTIVIWEKKWTKCHNGIMNSAGEMFMPATLIHHLIVLVCLLRILQTLWRSRKGRVEKELSRDNTPKKEDTL